MGNSNSSPTTNPSKERKQSPEIVSSTHKSLRSKKKSLELPDLASLTLSSSSYYGRGRHPIPPKSACIPIPQSNNPHAVFQPEPRTRPQNNFSTTDMLVTEPSTRLPFPPPPRGHADAALAAAQQNGSANQYFRGAQQQRKGYQPTNNHRNHHQKIAQLQEMYNQSNVVPAPPPSSFDSNHRHTGFVPEVVHSSVPIGLLKGITTPTNELVSVKIVWRGGGKSVILARAGDHDWKGRQAMERESPSSQMHSTTVNLTRGTHHFRFLVDDQWRVADDLPTAVDDQGTLANYVAIPLSVSPPKNISVTPLPPPQVQRHIPGQSFWSAASSADGDVPEPPRQTSLHYQTAVWTSEIPPELVEAAREEEVYLQASAGQYEANDSRGGTTYVNGFVPAPNIPPAPGLPRHLDKLILNTRMSPAPGSSTPGKTNAAGKPKGKDRDKSDKEGRRHEKRDKRFPPPAPPPSEDGNDPTSPEPQSSNPEGTTTPPTLDTSAGLAPSTTTGSLDTAARSRLIGIDPANTPALTDDASVLPVPSHVVLHHLCTSAIRNGVLAVANTTRYREKYLTTVYYKPT